MLAVLCWKKGPCGTEGPFAPRASISSDPLSDLRRWTRRTVLLSQQNSRQDLSFHSAVENQVELQAPQSNQVELQAPQSSQIELQAPQSEAVVDQVERQPSRSENTYTFGAAKSTEQPRLTGPRVHF